MDKFEEEVKNDLHTYLRRVNEAEEKLPDAPDIEEKWEQIARSYMPDGIREYKDYPNVSLGWMMYIGMAVTKYWDEDWEVYGKLKDIYANLRAVRGFDEMDEYVREKILLLEGADFDKLEKIVGECAARTNNKLIHQHIEPGTPEAYRAFLACLHQMYAMGAAMQLYRMGYRMTRIN
ncbi:MAG: hypothetical protein MJZ69_06270 [Bacteroidaceae bacterium]|nr:hypothetical protein [Bacteroidaceae bacterium]